MAEFGNVGLYADDVLSAQLIGFALEAIDRDFACVVNETCQVADLAACEGLERRQKALAWCGIANTYYWLDPSWKVAGVLMSQILPFADPAVLGLSDQFERGVYKIAV